MILPWEQGIIKQIKDVFLCDVLECEPVKEEDNKEEPED